MLDKCYERVFRGYQEEAVDVKLGLYIIRGDNLFVTHQIHTDKPPTQHNGNRAQRLCLRDNNRALIGKVNEELESKTDISTLRAPPLRPVRH